MFTFPSFLVRANTAFQNDEARPRRLDLRDPSGTSAGLLSRVGAGNVCTYWRKEPDFHLRLRTLADLLEEEIDAYTEKESKTLNG